MHSNFEVFNVSDAEVIDTICKSGIEDKEKRNFQGNQPVS